MEGAFKTKHIEGLKMGDVKKVSNFSDAYGYDPKKADGTWFDVNGIRTKLAYANSEKVEAEVQSVRQRLSDKLGRELRTEEHEEIGTDVFVNHVLLDWEVSDGLECTEENKRDIIQKFPKYLNDCMAICQNNKKFQEERISKQTKK